MVFLIQRAQNRERTGGSAQARLGRIGWPPSKGPATASISVEDLSETELKVLRIDYQRLAEMAKRDETITESHSVEEAEARHNFKEDRRKARRIAR